MSSPNTRPDQPPTAAPNPRSRQAAVAFSLLLVLLAVGGGYGYAESRRATQPVLPTAAPPAPSAVVPTAAPRSRAPEVAAALRARYADFLAQPLTLTYGDRSWRPRLSELGATLEIDAAAEAIAAAGQADALLSQSAEPAAPLRLSLDRAALARYLNARAAEIERPAADARLALLDSEVSATPAVPGLALLRDEALEALASALETLAPQTVALPTRAVAPRIGDDALLAPQEAIEAYLQGPLTLRVGKQKRVLSTDEIAQLLRVRPAGARLDVTVDDAALAQLLQAIADETETGGSRPRVEWNGGDLAIAEPGKPSLRIDEAQAKSLLLAALPAAERAITLPTREAPPSINEQTLAQLGIKELVSLGQSDFAGSAAYRVTNIKAGLRLLDGLLIAPGEEFSFNRAVGQINAANGFVEGYAIVQNRTQLEWGGGICQDSTTLFRAAFWAGLPITERNQHSFYISWYDKYGIGEQGNGPGLDAAIFTGVKDLRFSNDTGGWLLIQTSVDTKRTLAEVRLYGTKPNRSVRAVSRVYNRTAAPSQPRYLPDSSIPPGTRKQSDTARGGMTIDVDRIISENGVEREPERFRTIYKPWPDIFLYNPADLVTPSPTPPLDATPPVEGAPPVGEPTPTVEGAPPLEEPTAPPADGAPPAEPTPPAIEVPPVTEPPPDEAPPAEPTPVPLAPAG